MAFLSILAFFFVAQVSVANAATQRYIFAFGDSYTAYGFKPGNPNPTQNNPLGNPAYGNGTTCGAGCPNWLQRLTVNLSVTNTLAFNYAQGGAVLDRTQVNDPNADDLSYQVGNFTYPYNAGTHPSYAPWNATDSVFIFWFGVNDLGAIISLTNLAYVHAALYNDLQNLFTKISTLYNDGARRFVVANTPPIDRMPCWLNHQAEMKSNISIWNSVLPSKVSSYMSATPSATIAILDTQPIFSSVLDNQAAYPTPALADGCLHPGPAIQSLVANGMYSVLKSPPINFYKTP